MGEIIWYAGFALTFAMLGALGMRWHLTGRFIGPAPEQKPAKTDTPPSASPK